MPIGLITVGSVRSWFLLEDVADFKIFLTLKLFGSSILCPDRAGG
jgi:hypothetical protein